MIMEFRKGMIRRLQEVFYPFGGYLNLALQKATSDPHLIPSVPEGIFACQKMGKGSFLFTLLIICPAFIEFQEGGILRLFNG
jgi:hypothetical protein